MAKFMFHYTKPNVWKIGSLRFLPGINEVDEAAWNKVKDHPLLQERFNSGALLWVKGPGVQKKEVPEDVPPEEVESDVEALDGMTSDEAKALVAKTFSLDLLNSWLELETRKGVLKAIEAQIEAVTPKEGDYRGENGDGDNA